jgi:YesN/AraC family two-component response regulator
MMPKMDGFELVEKLKSDVNTSHIPIIVLTAKTEIEELKRGFRIGADDYITKPFDADVLRIRIENLIQNRIKLQEKYSKNFSLESLGIDVQSADEKFMQKLYTVLQQNLSNSELNLDSFCKELGLSKSNLYRKIKQITGSSPNEFVRNFRLNTAAKMLKETDMSITDIYCAVGYNSLAYFSNSFKSLYGMSPTEYKNHS